MKTNLFAALLLLSITLSAQDPDWWNENWNDKNKNTYGYSDLYFGWNGWRNGDGMAEAITGDPLTTELNFWSSGTWGFGFGQVSKLGQGGLSIRYGLQFNWHFFRLKSNTIPVKGVVPTTMEDGTFFVADSSVNYKKSTMRITYLDVPVLLQFSTDPNGTGGFNIAAGGYVGVRLGSSHKSKFSDAFGDNTKSKVYNDYFTNQFRYGIMAQAGFGGGRVTVKYDLNTLFQDSKSTPDYQVFSITLGWMVP